MTNEAKPAGEEGQQLIRGVGLTGATTLNMIDMIGVGPFITIPLIIAAMGGPQAMLGWIVGALLVVCDGLVWAELGAAFPGSGGSYRYLREIYGPNRLGRLMSFLFIWQLTFSAPLSIASGCIGFASYAAYAFPALDTALGAREWRLPLHLGGLDASLGASVVVSYGTFVAIGTVAVAVILLYRKITIIEKFAGTLWVGVMLTIVWIIASGVWHFNPALVLDFPPDAFRLTPEFFQGLGAALLIAVYDYWGYYNVCFFGGEVRDPSRTIPRAVLYSILAVAAIYIVMNVSILGVIPWREFAGTAETDARRYVISTFMQRLYGNWAGLLATLLIMWTAFASVFSLLLGYSRVPYAAAQDGNYFRVFSRVHPRHRFPYVSLLVMGGIAALFCFLRLADVIAALVVIRILVQFVAQIVGVAVLRVRRPDLARPFRMWLYPLPALVALFGFLYVLFSRKNFMKEVVYAVVLVAVGLAIYFVRARARGEWPFRRAAAVALAGLLLLQPLDGRAQVRAVYDRGAAGVGQMLRRLQTTASAMHTGAHPDDEDTALIARLARGDSARVAYLSLNRGEGGQNIIGPELFEPLGVIRTEELLQARRLDGGEQLFTRTFDYGFSKTRAEAAAKWGERVALGDMVRAIRLFRPLVVVSRFSGTPADGHGQHQLAGHLTPLAVRAAADPKEFPEHLAEGLRPWQALKLYVGQGFGQSEERGPVLRVETGVYDPLIGRTYFEVAMEGRSQHKSQEMGLLELRGPQASNLRLAEIRVRTGDGPGQNIFDDIDTSLRGIPRLAHLFTDVIDGELSAAQGAAARALSEFDALRPAKVVAPLAEGLAAVRRAREKLATASAPAEARYEADFLLARKEGEFEEAIRRAAGVEMDALASAETVAPGESVSVAVRAFAPKGAEVSVGRVRLRAPEGWRSETAPEPLQQQTGFRRTESATKAAFFTLSVPAGAKPTQPYWLAAPRDGYVFRWPDGAPKNEPFGPPAVSAEAELEIGGTRLVLSRPVEFRYADGVRGEVRRELNVVPALTVSLGSSLLVAPTGKLPHASRVSVRVTNNSQSPAEGSVRLRAPDGWGVSPAAAPFKLSKKGAGASAVFTVTAPRAARPGEYRLAAEAEAGGGVYGLDMQTIAYPHIQTHRLYRAAEASVRVFDLKVAPVRVGYVMGSGDEVPAAIERMGLGVTMLGEEDLASGDLSRFDTIVVGVRASEVRPDFVANNDRLLDFVRRGGTLVVQYQRPDYLNLGLAPLPAKMSARVADEEAPVTVLRPEHPAFNFPNRIGPADWQGWVQERSLYNLTTFDAGYVPLLESHDEGEEPQRGGEVYAEIGRGRYVYTSYAWFRQLPSGVPGAYRLFANLISLGAAQRRRN